MKVFGLKAGPLERQGNVGRIGHARSVAARPSEHAPKMPMFAADDDGEAGYEDGTSGDTGNPLLSVALIVNLLT